MTALIIIFIAWILATWLTMSVNQDNYMWIATMLVTGYNIRPLPVLMTVVVMHLSMWYIILPWALYKEISDKHNDTYGFEEIEEIDYVEIDSDDLPLSNAQRN